MQGVMKGVSKSGSNGVQGWGSVWITGTRIVESSIGALDMNQLEKNDELVRNINSKQNLEKIFWYMYKEFGLNCLY